MTTTAAHPPSVKREQSAVDERCRRIATEVIAGRMDEVAGRHEIAEILFRTDIAGQTARHRSNRPPQVTIDLTERLNALLTRKVLGLAENESSVLDLNRLLTASASGWARQLLRSALRSESRNLNTKTAKWESPVDPFGATVVESADSAGESSTETTMNQVFANVAGAPSPEETALEGISEKNLDRLQSVAEWVSTKSRSVRGASRVSMHAVAVMWAKALPYPLRPHYEVRHHLQQLVAEDPELAWASAARLLQLCGGDVPSEVPDVHPDLVAVWDDYSPEALYTLVHSDRRYVDTLMDWALMDWPRLSRPAQRELTMSVRGALKFDKDSPKTKEQRIHERGLTARWRDVSTCLVESFVALEFEAISDFDSMDEEFKAQRLDGWAVARQLAPARLKAAATFPGSPLGATPAAVHRSLMSIVEPRVRDAAGASMISTPLEVAA